MPSPISMSYKLPIPGQVPVTVKMELPSHPTPNTPTLIIAHGASNDLNLPLLVGLATALAAGDHAIVVRFNFPYVERGATSPDSRNVLEDTMMAVYSHMLERPETGAAPVFVGGKSLGALTAAELVSRGPGQGGVAAAGLVLLGYPLHPPGRRNRPLLKALRHIDIPSLFFAGTQDPLCSPALLRPVLDSLIYRPDLYIIQGADHSLEPPDSSDHDRERVFGEVVEQVEAFILRTLGGWS